MSKLYLHASDIDQICTLTRSETLFSCIICNITFVWSNFNSFF